MLANYKVWFDVATALWLIFLVCTMTTQNTLSMLLYQFTPAVLAALLLLSQARVLFG